MFHFSFSRRKFWKSVLHLFLFLLPAVVIIAIILWFVARQLWAVEIPVSFLFGILYGLAVPTYLRWLMRVTDKIYDNHLAEVVEPVIEDMYHAKRGYQGEDDVRAWIDAIKGDWRVLQNLEYQDQDGGKTFDIDFVLVGKRGVFVLEVKNFSCDVEFAGDKYYVVYPNHTKVFEWKDPRWQTGRNAAYIDGILQKHHIEVWSRKALIFPREGSVKFDDKPGVYIANSKESLKNYLSHGESYDLLPQQIDQICEVLGREAVK